jgi:hypothetical protein
MTAAEAWAQMLAADQQYLAARGTDEEPDALARSVDAHDEFVAALERIERVTARARR